MMLTLEKKQAIGVKEAGSLPRLAYLIITLGCFIMAVSLWFSGYHGYSGLLVAIGLAAAINLK